MTRKCPKCGRQFKRLIGDHNCVKISVSTHLKGKNPNVKAVFKKILKAVRKFGKVHVHPVKGSITLKNTSRFMGLRLSENWVTVDFFSPIEINEFPIHKTMRYSKTKIVHFVQLESPKEVDSLLVHWLKVSYDLYGNK